MVAAPEFQGSELLSTITPTGKPFQAPWLRSRVGDYTYLAPERPERNGIRLAVKLTNG